MQNAASQTATSRCVCVFVVMQMQMQIFGFCLFLVSSFPCFLRENVCKYKSFYEFIVWFVAWHMFCLALCNGEMAHTHTNISDLTFPNYMNITCIHWCAQRGIGRQKSMAANNDDFRSKNDKGNEANETNRRWCDETNCIVNRIWWISLSIIVDAFHVLSIHCVCHTEYTYPV